MKGKPSTGKKGDVGLGQAEIRHGKFINGM